MRIGRTRLIVAFALGLSGLTLSAGAAQPTKVPLIGVLSNERYEPQPFVQGLLDLGYVEGQNIAVERRYAGGKYEAFPSLAAELVRHDPDIIVTVGTPAALAARTRPRRFRSSLCPGGRSDRLRPRRLACTAGRKSDRVKRANARARRQAPRIPDHSCSRRQARGRSLGFELPSRHGRIQGDRGSSSVLESRARSRRRTTSRRF